MSSDGRSSEPRGNTSTEKQHAARGIAPRLIDGQFGAICSYSFFFFENMALSVLIADKVGIRSASFFLFSS
jgi:hypothetical protein